jgi:hypothetical protein
MSAALVRFARRYQAMRSLLSKLQESLSARVLRQVLDPDELDQLLRDIPPIAEGTPAAASDVPQCGLLWSSNQGSVASGVLVGPDILLTAAHVQFDVHPDRVSLGIADASQRAAAAVPVKPCAITADPWGIALFRLASPPNVTPISVATAAEFDAFRTQGGTVRLYGFGYGRTCDDAELPAGVKRYLDHVPILPDTSPAVQKIPDYDPRVMFAVGAVGASAPYAVACSGDSGGPAIAMINGGPKLVGIIQSASGGVGSLPDECGLATMAALSRTDQPLKCPDP